MKCLCARLKKHSPLCRNFLEGFFSWNIVLYYNSILTNITYTMSDAVKQRWMMESSAGLSRHTRNFLYDISHEVSRLGGVVQFCRDNPMFDTADLSRFLNGYANWGMFKITALLYCMDRKLTISTI